MRTRVQDWTRVRILTGPVITDHWTEAQTDQQNAAMLPHHDWKYVSFFKGIQRYLVVRVTVTGKEGFESRDIHQTNTRHF